MPQDDVARLLRSPVLLACRCGRAKSARADIVWHDTPQGQLAARNLSLSHAVGPHTGWRLERLAPDGRAEWWPAGPAPLLAEAASPAELGQPVPAPLAPIAAFQGRLRTLPLQCGDAPAQLCLLEGTLRGLARDLPTCRVVLTGEARSVAALALRLGETVRLSVPRAGLAAQAIATASGRPAEPRHTGAPRLPAGLSTGGALRLAAAHLADVILHWALLVSGSQSPEPVHQMRVAVRRLRSALTVFRRAAQPQAGAPPWLEKMTAGLKTLAAQLGAARDWDVFLAETGADIGRAFAHDRRVTGLLAAAGRCRAAAYADLGTVLASKAWQRFELTLALLPTAQPWHDDLGPGQAERLADPVETYAPRALERQRRAVLAPGPSLAGLPAEQLHDVRKGAKRLRYAIEVFAPLYPDKAVRKYLSRLEDLQEVLGAVNDTAVAGGLLAQLAGGAERAFAVGVVSGWGAARHAGAVGKVERAWGKLYVARPFWG